MQRHAKSFVTELHRRDIKQDVTLLFLLATDRLKIETAGEINAIRWTLWEQLDGLDFADDTDHRCPTQIQMQEKLQSAARVFH